MLEANMNERLREFDITHSQLNVLIFLDKNRCSYISQKDICDFLKVKHTSMIDVLKRLENKDLIIRNQNPDNPRCNLVILTEKADNLLKTMKENREYIKSVVFDGFSDDEVQSLDSYLERIINNLKGEK